MAVRIGILDDSSDIARTVGSTRRVVVASPSYLARRKKPRRPADLARHDIIQFTALSPTPEWRFTRDGETRRVSFSPRYVTNSADAAIGHAELGGGLAMVLSYQVEAAVRAGRLEVAPDPDRLSDDASPLRKGPRVRRVGDEDLRVDVLVALLSC